jgi:hypothetical protein
MYCEPLDIKNMHLTVFKFQGITFGGFEGVVKIQKNNTKMYTQEEADDLLTNFSA